MKLTDEKLHLSRLVNLISQKIKIRKCGALIFFYYFLIVLWLVFISIVFSFGKELPGNRRLLRVKTNSMIPTLQANSVILIKKHDEYQPQQIITYQPNSKFPLTDYPDELVTHRIQDKMQFNSHEWYYLTQGDAVEHPDGWVASSQVVGAVKQIFPTQLGWLLYQYNNQLFAKITLLWLPIVVFVGIEIKEIFKEVKKSKPSSK